MYSDSMFVNEIRSISDNVIGWIKLCLDATAAAYANATRENATTTTSHDQPKYEFWSNGRIRPGTNYYVMIT